MIYVDRIENGFAVLEIEKDRFDTVPLSVLPEGTREGSALEFVGGVYQLNEAAERVRRRRLIGIQARLFGDGE